LLRPGSKSGPNRSGPLEDIPSQDDPELTALMEAVRRLPRDRADTVIESMLRCALGFERTGSRLLGGGDQGTWGSLAGAPRPAFLPDRRRARQCIRGGQGVSVSGKGEVNAA
jgi:hypothetical protein